jgi:hypothetical protein
MALVGVGAWIALPAGEIAVAESSTSSAQATDAFDVFSVATGRRNPRFLRIVRDAHHDPEVLAVVPDGSGGWFVGGAFGKRDGVPCPNLVHFTSSGRIDPRFCPAPNGRVVALLADRGALFVAGSFTRVGAARRNYLAALDEASGRLQRWDAHIAGKIYYDRGDPIPRGVWSLAAHGHTLFIAGQFDSIAGRPRQNVAALNPADGRATAFRAPPIDGSALIVVTDSSAYVGSRPIALNPKSGKRQNWRLEGPPVEALVIHGNTLIASHFLRNGNAAVVAEYRVATGKRLGTIASSVSNDYGIDISTLALHGYRLYVGGVFSRVNNTPRQSLVSFNLPSRRPLPWHPAGARSGFGNTLAIAATSTAVAVGVGTCRPTC